MNTEDNNSTGLSSSLASGYQPRTLEDKWVNWTIKRAFNDREWDAALFMALLGLWIWLWRPSLDQAAWWHEVFTVLPAWLWGALLLVLGVLRGSLAVRKSSLQRLYRKAILAGASAMIYAFLATLIAHIEFRMTVFPILILQCAASIKSYLRLMYQYRAESNIGRRHKNHTNESGVSKEHVRLRVGQKS